MHDDEAKALATAATNFMLAIKSYFPIRSEAGLDNEPPPDDEQKNRGLVFDAAERLWKELNVPTTSPDDDHTPFIETLDAQKRREACRELYAGFHALVGRWEWGFFLEPPVLRLPPPRRDRDFIFARELTYMDGVILHLMPNQKIAYISDNEDRDEWIFKEYERGIPLKKIVRDLACQRGWEPIHNLSGITQAVKRFAKRKGLPLPTRRPGGKSTS